ncbi:hypothetical protein QTN47_02940 [Danxiaibacter flavus]|uniref:Uncharacterized protein n=1 Tax=Danxiaibacter flavus TaxID=3049108 RepID=A0ABV3ZAC0_9BACT|nr:hypothetical protein QNM32_02935 [Chitinophagaceae bacterium DXS]
MKYDPFDFVVTANLDTISGTLIPIGDNDKDYPKQFNVVIEDKSIGLLQCDNKMWTFQHGDNKELAEAIGEFVIEWYKGE